MWKRISSWLRHVSNGWVALSALVIFLLFSALVLPRQSATADEVAGGAGSPEENVSTSLVLGRYPKPTAVVDVLAPVFTSLKWGFLAGWRPPRRSHPYWVAGLSFGPQF
jgi:hypothetical protein